MHWDVDELIKAFMLRGGTDELSMAGFKEQFAPGRGSPQRRARGRARR